MPVYRLDDRLLFLRPTAVRAGDRSRSAATCGPSACSSRTRWASFPWQGDLLHWHSPDPRRMVLLAEDLLVTRSLAKTLRQGRFDRRPRIPRGDGRLRHGSAGRARTGPGSRPG
ncbi:MAG: hypothetical protein U0599_03855 [Vicinamibacteria bacterium]